MEYFPPKYKDRVLLERVAKIAHGRGVFTNDEYTVLQHILPFEEFELLSIPQLAKRMNRTILGARNLQDKAAKKLRYYATHPELCETEFSEGI